MPLKRPSRIIEKKPKATVLFNLKEEEETSMITLTENAANEVKRLMQAQNLTDVNLRMGVKGGGCSGMSYTLNFESETREQDQIFDVHGVKVVVDPKSLLYLEGTTLDFVNGLEGTGFKFVNPNATKSCGCGSSFSA
jgi:iron-sulfur cluster assembly protein